MYKLSRVLKLSSYLYAVFYINLIGNYNDNPADDNIMADGKPTGNTNELGESWQVPDERPE